MVTVDELKKYVVYDPDTGIFTSTFRPSKKVGHLNKDKYVILRVGRKSISGGKAAFLFMKGHLPSGEIDHINQIRDDNRWVNLREVTHNENCLNKGMYVNNKSGYKGVSFHKATKKWRVSIKYKNKQYEGGLFGNKEDAAEFADLVRQMLTN